MVPLWIFSCKRLIGSLIDTIDHPQSMHNADNWTYAIKLSPPMLETEPLFEGTASLSYPHTPHIRPRPSRTIMSRRIQVRPTPAYHLQREQSYLLLVLSIYSRFAKHFWIILLYCNIFSLRKALLGTEH